MAGKPLKILIADDDPEIISIEERCFRHLGYEVVTACDGAEAWDKVKSDDPDMLILDINMPHKDGLTVLKDLRTNPPDKKWRPVAIVSGRDELFFINKGYELEADCYLTKPCSLEELARVVRIMTGLIPLRN